MIKLRVMAAAFLINGEDFLLMKRSDTRRLAPGIWAGVGGHLEPYEINNPEAACLREIYEETGLTERDISGLNLKYVILRRSKDEIRIQYLYMGASLKREVSQTDEGELFWIPKKELFERKLSATTRFTLEHYLKFGDGMKDILVGTVSAVNNRPVMNWCPVQDWEGMI